MIKNYQRKTPSLSDEELLTDLRRLSYASYLSDLHQVDGEDKLADRFLFIAKQEARRRFSNNKNQKFRSAYMKEML